MRTRSSKAVSSAIFYHLYLRFHHFESLRSIHAVITTLTAALGADIYCVAKDDDMQTHGYGVLAKLVTFVMLTARHDKTSFAIAPPMTPPNTPGRKLVVMEMGDPSL